MSASLGSRRALALAVPPVGAAALVWLTVANPSYNEPLFGLTAYYALFALVLIYTAVRVTALDLTTVRAWGREHAAGLIAALAVGAIAVLAINAEFRVLADEANLVGTSKHLYFQRTANFPVTGKWYYETYWTLGSVTARRPALYPFLVSLLHVVGGYRVEHAFHLNALVLVVLVFASYRLAKSFGGEVFGLTTALLVGAHPNLLIAARSGGFDLLATCLLVVTAQSFWEATKDPSPRRIAVLFLHLCLLANVRYEGWALLLLGLVLVFATRVARLTALRGYGWLYSLSPLLLLPRYWQTVAKADDQEQPLSASLFSFEHFWNNWRDFFSLLERPFDPDAPHSPLVILLAIAGLVLIAHRLIGALRTRTFARGNLQMLAFVLGFVGAQVVICFAYFWGRPLHPASARLFLWLDVTLAFLAGWVLTVMGRRLLVPVAALGRRSGAPVPLAIALALFAMAVPAAQEARFINALGLTRQAAQVWRYLDGLGTRRILVLSDRPGLYAIHDYGALSIVNPPRNLLYELSRHLYEDIYLIQEVNLAAHQPEPKFNPWPDVATETMLEFQNSATSSIRIARVITPQATSKPPSPPASSGPPSAPPPTRAVPSAGDAPGQ